MIITQSPEPLLTMKNIKVKDLKILCKFTNLESKGSEAEVESSGKGAAYNIAGRQGGL